MDEEEVIGQDLMSPIDFAKSIKAKYPEYESVDDMELATRMVEKYPVYKEKVDFSQKKKEGPQLPKQIEQESTSPDPELASETQTTSSDIAEEKKSKSLLEKGIDFANKFVMDNTVRGVDMLQHLKAGSSEMIAGLAGINNFKNKVAFTGGVKIASIFEPENAKRMQDHVDSLSEDEREKFINSFDITKMGQLSADAQNYMTDLSEEIRKKTIQYEGTITDDIANGRIDIAATRVANGVVESAPSVVVAAIPGGIVAIGAGSASQKQEDLEREGEKLDGDSIMNSLVTGTAEGVFERVTAGLLKPLKGVFKGNKKLADEFSKNFTKNLVTSMGLEGTSEGLTTITQQLSDDFFKDKELSITTGNFWKNVSDSFLIGAITGGGISSITLGAQKVMDKDTKEKVGKINEQVEIIDGDLQKDIPDDIKEQLQASKEKLIDSKNEIEQSEYEKFKALPKEERLELGNIEAEIDALKKEYDAINDDPNLSPESKKILLAEKSSEAENLVESKQDLIVANSPQLESEVNLPENAVETQETAEKTKVDLPQTPTDKESLTVENTPNSGELKYKLSDKGSEYSVQFKNGALDIKDSNGKEPSAPTKRKIQDKYADDFDFTQPEISEVANTLSAINTDTYIENAIDYKTRAIADNLASVNKESYIQFGDKNNIGINMAKSYFGKKGEGRALDVLAQELTEDYGVQITPQDLVDHMETYTGGRNDVYKEVRDNDIKPLQDKFTELTGLPANDKFVAKAIESKYKGDEDFSITDQYSDAELLNLLNEREQSFTETEARTETPSRSQDGPTVESSRTDEEGSRVQEESREESKPIQEAKKPRSKASVITEKNLPNIDKVNQSETIAVSDNVNAVVKTVEFPDGSKGYNVQFVRDGEAISDKNGDFETEFFQEESADLVKFLDKKQRGYSLAKTKTNKSPDTDTKTESKNIVEKDTEVSFDFLGSPLEGTLKPDGSIVGKDGTNYDSNSNSVSNVKEITDASRLDKIVKFLDKKDSELKDFQDNTLGIGIPVAIARGALSAMKLAVKAAKTSAEVIKAGLDYIKSTQWYKNLSDQDKNKINNDSLDSLIANSISEQENLTPKQAKQKTDKIFKKAEKDLENKITPKKRIQNAVRKVIQAYSDRQFVSKKLVDEAGLQNTKNLMINSHGASGKAKRMFDKAYKEIYGKLSDTDRNALDQIIQLKRFIAIDKNRSERGLEEVIHPGYIDGETSLKSLEGYKDQLGDAKFKDLEKRAKAYFKVYADLLKAIHKNGLISKESFDSLNGLDYQPRLFIQHITDFEGSVSLGSAATEKSDTGGLSKLQILTLDKGSDSSLVTNSEWLLSTSIVGRMKAMAMNNINREFISKEYPAAKEKFQKLKDKSKLTREEKRFVEYFKELSSKVKEGPLKKTPKNFKKAYWYENGQQKEFYLEEKLHDSWFNNTKGIISSDAKEFISMASGSALLKGIATGNNPAFAIVNTPRDFLFTSVFSKEYSDFVPKAMFDVARDTFKAVSEISKSAKDTTGKNLFNKYIEYGGDMAFLSTQGRLKKNTAIGSFIDKSVSKRSKDRFKSVFDKATLSNFSTYSEIMFRMALFQRTIKNELKARGVKSIENITDKSEIDAIYNQAVANARIILDFNQGGTISKDMEAVVPYINTAIQGTRVAADAFIKDPATMTFRTMQAAVMGSSFIAASSLMAIALFKGEEDEEKSAAEIYLDAMDGISQYQKTQYFNIVTGRKDENGQYEVLKIAKNHQMTPIYSFTDNVLNNQLLKIAGKDQKSYKNIYNEVFDAFNTNISPVSLNSPAQNATRNPALKAILTYATGYDFYRDQPLARNVNKDPKPLEGQSMKNVEDFYKKLGKDYDLSPVRVKGAVESFITTPSTNPFVGMLYGGADAIASDKTLQETGSEFYKNIKRSTVKRVVTYSSDFNRSLNKNKEFLEKEERLKIDEGFNKLDQKDLARRFTEGKIEQSQFMEELRTFDVTERKKIVERVQDYKRLSLVVDRSIIDIKYAGSSKLRALMILNRYGDIFDGSEDSRKVLRQMKISKGILTQSVLIEYQKLKKEVESN